MRNLPGAPTDAPRFQNAKGYGYSSPQGNDSESVSRHSRSVPRGEPRVALVGAENTCEVEPPGQRQRLGVDLRPADDEHLLVLGKECDGLLQRVHDRAARNRSLLPRDDDVGAVGKRTPERLPGLAAHDDRMARRHGLEMPEVLGNVPQQGILGRR